MTSGLRHGGFLKEPILKHALAAADRVLHARTVRGSRSRFAGYILAALVLSAPGAANAQTREISFSLSTSSLGGAAPKIANELGLFEKRGLKPRFIQMDSSNASTSALIGGSVQFALSGPGEIVIAQARGRKVIWIATAYQGFAANIVISNAAVKRVGISPSAPASERLKALNGLLIATVSATSATTVAYKSAAEAQGAQLRFVYMPQPTMAQALESGAIDGYISVAPFWGVPVIRGTGVVWLNGPKGDLPPEITPATNAIIQTMRSTADADPELVKGVVDVFADLGKVIQERPADVKAAVSTLFPGLDPATLNIVYEQDSRGWNASPPTVDLVAHEIAVMKRTATGELVEQIGDLKPEALLYP